eukprot:Gb_14987 [translate_table: standard]
MLCFACFWFLPEIVCSALLFGFCLRLYALLCNGNININSDQSRTEGVKFLCIGQTSRVAAEQQVNTDSKNLS